MMEAMTQATLNPFRFPRHESVYASRLRHPLRYWGSSARRVFVTILAVTVGILPVGSALAGESVLEIPSAGGSPAALPPSSASASSYGAVPNSSAPPDASSSYASGSGPDSSDPDSSGPDAYAAASASSPGANSNPNGVAPATVAANAEPYTPDPNLGSIDDYQNQPGQNGQQQPAGIYFGGNGRPNEPPRSMTSNLIVGGLLVGLVAMELAAHHHHR
jgi:hypothetical protein